MSEVAMFFVGWNMAGEFGLGHMESLKMLQQCPNKSITKVFSSDNYSIFSDDDYKQLWAAGDNSYGQCCIGAIVEDAKMLKNYQPITYFQRNEINVQKVCVRISAHNVFFISDKGQLYGCGKNAEGMLGITNNHQIQHEPVLIPSVTNVIDAQSSASCTVILCSSDNRHVLLYRLLLKVSMKGSVSSTTTEESSLSLHVRRM